MSVHSCCLRPMCYAPEREDRLIGFGGGPEPAPELIPPPQDDPELIHPPKEERASRRWMDRIMEVFKGDWIKELPRAVERLMDSLRIGFVRVKSYADSVEEEFRRRTLSGAALPRPPDFPFAPSVSFRNRQRTGPVAPVPVVPSPVPDSVKKTAEAAKEKEPERAREERDLKGIGKRYGEVWGHLASLQEQILAIERRRGAVSRTRMRLEDRRQAMDQLRSLHSQQVQGAQRLVLEAWQLEQPLLKAGVLRESNVNKNFLIDPSNPQAAVSLKNANTLLVNARSIARDFAWVNRGEPLSTRYAGGAREGKAQWEQVTSGEAGPAAMVRPGGKRVYEYDPVKPVEQPVENEITKAQKVIDMVGRMSQNDRRVWLSQPGNRQYYFDAQRTMENANPSPPPARSPNQIRAGGHGRISAARGIPTSVSGRQVGESPTERERRELEERLPPHRPLDQPLHSGAKGAGSSVDRPPDALRSPSRSPETARKAAEESRVVLGYHILRDARGSPMTTDRIWITLPNVYGGGGYEVDTNFLGAPDYTLPPDLIGAGVRLKRVKQPGQYWYDVVEFTKAGFFSVVHKYKNDRGRSPAADIEVSAPETIPAPTPEVVRPRKPEIPPTQGVVEKELRKRVEVRSQMTDQAVDEWRKSKSEEALKLAQAEVATERKELERIIGKIHLREIDGAENLMNIIQSRLIDLASLEITIEQELRGSKQKPDKPEPEKIPEPRPEEESRKETREEREARAAALLVELGKAVQAKLPDCKVRWGYRDLPFTSDITISEKGKHYPVVIFYANRLDISAERITFSPSHIVLYHKGSDGRELKEYEKKYRLAEVTPEIVVDIFNTIRSSKEWK